MRVYLVRHGQTEWNARGLLQGTVNTPLNAVGEAQARAAALDLGARLDGSVTVVSSPLARAHSTAQAIADVLGAPVATHEDLRERSYGLWEGLTLDECEARWPEEMRVWRAQGDPDVPGIERTDDVAERMVAALEELSDAADGALVAVTHGSAARMAIVRLLGLSDRPRTFATLGNASWSILTRHSRGDWTLERHNIAPPASGAAA